MTEAIKKEKKKERRISLFLGYYEQDNHFVDDTIFNYFNDIPNKANIIKKLLFEYAINNSGGNIATPNVASKTTEKDTLKVTDKVTHSVTDNVTEEVTLKETEKEQLGVTPKDTSEVTESVTVEEQEEDDDIEIVTVKPKEKKSTEDDKTKKANAFMNSLNNFTW